MKKLIPYILAYLIVAAGTAVYAHFSSRAHANLLPPNSVTVTSSLSHDELAAKLDQAGFHETLTIQPAPMLSLVLHFVIFAVYLAAFAVLTHLFQRTFHTDIPSHDHAA